MKEYTLYGQFRSGATIYWNDEKPKGMGYLILSGKAPKGSCKFVPNVKGIVGDRLALKEDETGLWIL